MDVIKTKTLSQYRAAHLALCENDWDKAQCYLETSAYQQAGLGEEDPITYYDMDFLLEENNQKAPIGKGWEILFYCDGAVSYLRYNGEKVAKVNLSDRGSTTQIEFIHPIIK